LALFSHKHMRTSSRCALFIISGKHVQDRGAPSGTPHVIMRRYYNKNLPAQSSQINHIKNIVEILQAYAYSRYSYTLVAALARGREDEPRSAPPRRTNHDFAYSWWRKAVFHQAGHKWGHRSASASVSTAPRWLIL